MEKIIYTKTDEAPALATASLLPIIKGFAATAGIQVELVDISLAARILAGFPEVAGDSHLAKDTLDYLGQLVNTDAANIIKLPNISASVPQLKNTIAELQKKGFALPNFPDSPKSKEEEEVRALYAKALGSAVNPVLRQGNSDRRVAPAVKEYARANPHSMGQWSSDSRTHVAHMQEGDFFASEQSVVMEKDNGFCIEFVAQDGTSKVLKDSSPLLVGEVIDSAVMSVKKLRLFFEEEIAAAKRDSILLSLHLKATMMKVSDPIIFGHALETYFAPLFEKYGNDLKKLGVNSHDGLTDLQRKLESLPAAKQEEIKQCLSQCFASGPSIAMVDSGKGITNFHVPSDVIIDASMPACIRDGGKMWDREGKLQDTKALIPDRSYAGIYQVAIDFCRQNGAFDPAKMGSVSNVGLMGKKAEEYGSHDKTFELEADGKVVVLDSTGKKLMEHSVCKGDIFRMCQTKDDVIRDWVKLAVNRARITNTPVFFWLNKERDHDKKLIGKVEQYLKEHDTDGLDIKIISPEKAALLTLERSAKGLDTISATGNVLRDYLTDLFPILELGTSAKMLSVVPLLKGGILCETGAGGSAPKHVKQLLEENHLRWDSLGELLAFQVSLEELGRKSGNKKAVILAETLETACQKYLSENKSPSRRVGEPDNRNSHYFFASYWSKALSEQCQDEDLQDRFSLIAGELHEREEEITKEMLDVQGKPVDIGGYYLPDDKKMVSVMRPSNTFNAIIDVLYEEK